ncbi:MAG: ABC transporter ATP-binding protein/permease [Lachnospiraceae bacterium]|nr:ABC transporter ATP-binding protein/permease [Lachnospiraceae bacterium]
MLQIVDVCKEYKTGSLVQKALDHVSFNLRDNEFVAILGPSGSGKTTLLNIIGGLDRYDSGDLIINDVSTKKYTDRDWDSYRNHTIGFVFQSYNLIPHQTVQKNVELALTISGVSGKERSRRAYEALEKVGLAEHAHKIPNQLSGGQMQRVAIARALVNDPDILLADEPTGALDSDTSLQVMDLLKEIAADRLVVMVTHNPELADRYATRIIRLQDGRIIADSAPCEVAAAPPAVHRNLGKSSMSFLAAIFLSFNNLMTKKARTILVAFAGSIGIIGIALILSMSYGGTQYIHGIEERTLSEYPITITSSGLDLSAMLAGTSLSREELHEDNKVRAVNLIKGFFSGLSSNDLKALKAWFDSGESHIHDYARAVEYAFDLEPQIYRLHKGRARRIHPDSTFESLGFGGASLMSSFTGSNMYGSDIFHALPEERSLYESHYELVAGRWPENELECVLVLTPAGSVSDLLLYQVGIKDADEMDELLKKFANGEEAQPKDVSTEFYDYEDFLALEFSVVSPTDLYLYDKEYNVYKDKTEDRYFMRNLVENGLKLKISGIVKGNAGDTAAILSTGICYEPGLIPRVLSASESAAITKAQLADPETNVFTGKDFGDEEEESGFDMASLIAINEDAIKNAFHYSADDFNMDGFSDLSDLDLSSAVDFTKIDLSNIQVPQADLASVMQGVNVQFSPDGLRELFTDVAEDYTKYASSDESTDYTRLPESMNEFFQTEEAQEIISNTVTQFAEENAKYLITGEQLTEIMNDIFAAYLTYAEEEGITDPQELIDGFRTYLESEAGQALVEEKAQMLREQLSNITFPEEEREAFTKALTEAYDAYAEKQGYPELEKIRESMDKYFERNETKQLLSSGMLKFINLNEISNTISSRMAATTGAVFSSIETQLNNAITEIGTNVTTEIEKLLKEKMNGFTDNMENAFSVDPSAFSDAITINMDPEELKELLLSLMTKEPATYSGNLKKLGYTDIQSPLSITIYPAGFEQKEEILKILDGYNERMKAEGLDDRVIRYTDYVGTLMSSVTDIINVITNILIAFVAISLVVSSIMIGVITYISVLERKKEIGILRSIGASKRNIAQVFNAETFLIGLLAGLIGVGLTLLILIPANIIIHSLTGQNDFNAMLPAGSAGLLVLISIILTLIGGWIPSRKAAKSDPVTALRTE